MFERFVSLRRAAGIAAFAAAVAAMAVPASAQTACLNHDKLADLLDGRYSEQPIAAGLESNGRLLEIFAAPDGATWTMVLTTPDGSSCVVAVGEEWQRPQQLAFEPET